MAGWFCLVRRYLGAFVPSTSAYRRRLCRTLLLSILLALALLSSVLSAHSMPGDLSRSDATGTGVGTSHHHTGVTAFDHSSVHAEPADAHDGEIEGPEHCAAPSGECCATTTWSQATHPTSPHQSAAGPERLPTWPAASRIAAGVGVDTAACPRPPSLIQLSISRV